MLLKKIKIKNFRSIEDYVLEIGSHGHRILVGKNESGKSNILKAIASCGGEYVTSDDDLRELADKGEVYCIFSLDDAEFRESIDAFVKEKISSYDGQVVDGKYTAYEILHNRSDLKLFYYYNKIGSKSMISALAYKGTNPIPELRSVSKVPASNQAYNKIANSNFLYYNGIDEREKEMFGQFLSETTYTDLFGAFSIYIREEYFELPRIFYWKYSEENNLPYKVAIRSFVNAPLSVSKPLLNMFRLHDVEESQIKEKFEYYIKHENKLDNWLNAISTSVNKFLKRRWRELGVAIKAKIVIESANDCTELRIKVVDDTNKYRFDQRSDGFRRLITFLLMIDAECKSGDITNDIILIDEPEMCLHPSSARELRDTLIEIGKNNFVIYATHSVSMIDPYNIDNNIIVSKEGEKTVAAVANEDAGFNAHSIYAALGQAVYENIHKSNVIVEGYSDSKIIKHFLNIKSSKNRFGVTFCGGMRGIQNVVSFLELGSLEYIILSDNDAAAIDKRDSFEKNGPKGLWFTYADADKELECLEDIYRKSFFREVADETIKTMLPSSTVSLEGLPSSNRLEWLSKELQKCSCENKLIKDVLRKIKDTALDAATKRQFNKQQCFDGKKVDKLIAFLRAKLEK
ncbi:AAA family ATPase [Desulfolutivibrio sp.]|uniref:AAA family ATPase n=1 Tax=Desulfolutivibrio sp. TaxID=2773296 RepID=UPI002F96143C